MTIPVVTGDLAMIKKGIEKHPEQITGNPNLAEMQKIAPTDTSHFLRKSLSM